MVSVSRLSTASMSRLMSEASLMNSEYDFNSCRSAWFCDFAVDSLARSGYKLFGLYPSSGSLSSSIFVVDISLTEPNAFEFSGCLRVLLANILSVRELTCFTFALLRVHWFCITKVEKSISKDRILQV